jgi:hypothetical protein
MCVTALQALVSCQPGTFMMTCRAVARRIGREVERTEGSSERRRTMILLQRVRSSRGGRVKLRPQAMCRSTEPIANHTLCIPLIPLPSTSCTLVLRVLLFTSSSASSSTNISTVSPGTSAIVGDFWATLVGGLGTLVLRWCMQRMRAEQSEPCTYQKWKNRQTAPWLWCLNCAITKCLDRNRSCTNHTSYPLPIITLPDYQTAYSGEVHILPPPKGRSATRNTPATTRV